jgi:hypothetical protein
VEIGPNLRRSLVHSVTIPFERRQLRHWLPLRAIVPENVMLTKRSHAFSAFSPAALQ